MATPWDPMAPPWCPNGAQGEGAPAAPVDRARGGRAPLLAETSAGGGGTAWHLMVRNKGRFLPRYLGAGVGGPAWAAPPPLAYPAPFGARPV